MDIANTMNSNITKYDQKCLEMLLAGDDPVLDILRHQIKEISSTKRQHTGVGEYLHFTLSEAAKPIPGHPRITFGDVEVACEDSEIAGGVLLQVSNGYLVTMESFSYEETWPEKMDNFSLRYIDGNSRDMTKLQATPGWYTPGDLPG